MVAERVAWTSAVTGALARGRAVVVLESTVIAQGLPWPENLETARAAESAVRQVGAEPATVAVLGGRVRIGLTDPELVEVARSAATETEIEAAPARDAMPADDAIAGNRTDFAGVRGSWAKANRRDLAPIVAAGRQAATTISATLWIARRFALEPRVMATGGLGGVHRDAAISFDLSTDLDELARADGALVVCSGMKSILDLSATLESLETRGVLVVGYRTDELPGFLVRSTGLPLEHRVDSPAEAAELVRVHRRLGLPGAIVLAQPVPESHALDHDSLRDALDAALADARYQGIGGKPLTPFLLDVIHRATAGRSLRANCALLVANARLAAEVAVELASPGWVTAGGQDPGDDLTRRHRHRGRPSGHRRGGTSCRRNTRGGSAPRATGRCRRSRRARGRGTRTRPLTEFETLDHVLGLFAEDDVVVPLGHALRHRRASLRGKSTR